MSRGIVPFAWFPRPWAPEGRGCACFTPVPSMGPGMRWVPSHCPENRTPASRTPIPSSLIFPTKRHGMTVRSSPFPGKVHSTHRKQKSDLSPGRRPASLRPPECPLLSPACHQAGGEGGLTTAWRALRCWAGQKEHELRVSAPRPALARQVKFPLSSCGGWSQGLHQITGKVLGR